jgi:PAS domain S-box-containing protein
VAETFVFFGCSFVIGQAVFLGWLHNLIGQEAYNYWIYVPVIWGAVRFGRRGTSLVIAMTAIQILLGIIYEAGYFATLAQTGLLHFWFYTLLMVILGMTLALVITERNFSLKVLSTSEERLKLAVASGQVGIWDLNLTTNTLIWDDTMFNLYGTNQQDFSGAYDAWTTRLHPEDKTVTEQALRDAILGKSDYKPEFRVVWPNGEVRSIKGHAKVILNESGEPVRMIGTNWDDTVQASTRLMLRTTHAAINTCKSAYYWINPTGQVIDSNEAGCLSLGFTYEELIGQSIWDFDPDFTPESWPTKWEKVRQVKKMIIESHHRRKDGSVFPVEVTCNFYYDNDNEYSFVFVQDITERKQAEHLLSSSENKYWTLFECAKDAIIIADTTSGLIIDCNEQAQQMLGKTKEAIIGLHQSAVHPPEKAEEYKKIFKEHVEKGKSTHKDVYLIH